MKKRIEDMDDHQLMVLIAEKMVQQERMKKILTIAIVVIAAGIVISLIVVIPQLVQVLTNANQILGNTSEIISVLK